MLEIKCPKINSSNVAEYYMLNQKCEWQETDFPNVAPPFPQYTIEFQMPDRIVIGGKTFPYNPETWTCKFEAKEVNPEDIIDGYPTGVTGWHVSFSLSQGATLNFDASYICDKEGLVIIRKVGDRQKGVWLQFNQPIPVRTEVEQRGFIDFCTVPVHICLLTLSFIHCKNVTSQEIDPNEGLPNRVKRHWEKKGRAPLEKFYTLHIEPMKEILRSEGQAESLGIAQALHICRGHFKNYINGKGLFGRYKGLFWWDSHVRGDKEAGIVDKEYDVNCPHL